MTFPFLGPLPIKFSQLQMKLNKIKKYESKAWLRTIANDLLLKKTYTHIHKHEHIHHHKHKHTHIHKHEHIHPHKHTHTNTLTHTHPHPNTHLRTNSHLHTLSMCAFHTLCDTNYFYLFLSPLYTNTPVHTPTHTHTHFIS